MTIQSHATILLSMTAAFVVAIATAVLNEAGWTAILVALAGLVTAITGVVKVLKEVKQVHVIVNSQKAALLQRIDDLEKLLAASMDREQKQNESS